MSESIEILKTDPLKQQPLKQLNRVAKKPPIDIEFQNLSYSVPAAHIKGECTPLLRSINGNFKSGELTAIMGPSGAGKTTLLNILAGYVTAGVKGSIKINGRPRDIKIFNKLSSYIMQDDLVQPRLSVRESMMVAANLKLGSLIATAEKVAIVDEVIHLLGLQKCYDTMAEHLSGGQRRRLTVALELVNNPPVIFLDEPTTGLDNVSIKQCVELLQKISRLGRTVICTIHQPPASLFQNFDQVYVMASGYCVYNGSSNNLVPFMSSANCVCPSTSTPADYIIELVQSNRENTNILQNLIQNGKCNWIEKRRKTSPSCSSIYEINNDTIQTDNGEQDNIIFPTSFWTQFCILLRRMFLQTRRNQPMLYIQFFHHLLSSLLLGGIFYGTGNDASQPISVFKYCISINVFFMYTYVMVPVLLLPLDVKLLKREYFNRWYSIKAYYFAMTVAAIPIMVVLSVMFLSIVYLLADQPMEINRFFWFTMMGLAVAFCSQGLGYTIGAFFNILNGTVVAPHVLALLLALAVYGMGYKDSIEPIMKVLMSASFLRFGLVGFSGTLFNHRTPMECHDIYCHYKNPELLMHDMGMADSKPENQLCAIIGSIILFRVLGYLALKYSMTSELRNQIVNYAAKIFKQKET